MLEWLFSLPAQWDAAGFDEDFGRFEWWKWDEEKYKTLGGCHFHCCDIVCTDSRHLTRTGGTRTCCVARGLLSVVHRILAAADPSFEPRFWQKYVEWADRGSVGARPQPPVPREELPLDSLERIGPHDAAEGTLAAFLYTFNLQVPNAVDEAISLDLPSGGGDMGWQLSGLQVKKVSAGGRADRAGVRAKHVILSVGGAEVSTETEVASGIAAGAASLDVVPARCQVRPFQLYGGLNWAMRERPTAEPEQAAQLDLALAIFRPWLQRLDSFVQRMSKQAALLFRGMARVRTGRYYKMGMKVTYHSFTSLSTDGKVAWKFAGADGGTWVTILAIAALPLRWLSQFPSEKELLLGANSEFTVMEKPAESTLAVCATTNDAFALSQNADSAGVDFREHTPAEAVEQRLEAMRSQGVIFRELIARYAEPRVRWERGLEACGLSEAADGEERLFAAFDRWLTGPTQWLLLVAPAGEGKSSALLRLHAQQLDPTSGTAVPFFTSLSLVGDPTQQPDWLLRQVRLQMAVGETELACLLRGDAIYFCDSADESGAPAVALKERSLAARAGIPSRHRGVISVREEDMERLGYEAADLAGPDGAVLRLLGFGEGERRRFCEQQARAAAESAAELLKAEPRQTAAARAEALSDIPGRLPADGLLVALQETARRADKKQIAELSDRFAEEAAQRTLAAVAALSPGEVRNALMFTMAAEVAEQLPEGADSGAVIKAWLQRRMRRLAARVEPSAWEAAGVGQSLSARLAALTRLAAALAAALTDQKKWGARVGAAVGAAAKLCEPLAAGAGAPDPGALLRLLPGVPLRAADAEDPESHCALPHRRIQEWLAAKWAERAAGRGLYVQAQNIVTDLTDWAGALGVAASAAARVAAAAQRAAEGGDAAAAEHALEARIHAASQLTDQEQAAEQLAALAAECAARYGEQSALTARALLEQGTTLRLAGRKAEAVSVSRRCAAAYAALGPAAPSWQLLLADQQLGAMLCHAAPPGASAQRAEGEGLLRAARGAMAAEMGEDDGVVGVCDSELAASLEARGELRAAEGLKRAELARSERVRGREHPETLIVLSNLAYNLEQQERWAEVLPLYCRCYEASLRVLPQGHPAIGMRERALRHCEARV